VSTVTRRRAHFITEHAFTMRSLGLAPLYSADVRCGVKIDTYSCVYEHSVPMYRLVCSSSYFGYYCLCAYKLVDIFL